MYGRFRRAAVLMLLILFLLPCPARAYESRETLREAWRGLDRYQGEFPFAAEPYTQAPYEPGALAPEALQGALEVANFLRSLADLPSVALSDLYTLQCQHGAALLAALGYAAHDAPKPEDMSDEFYVTAHTATMASNVARFNWVRPGVLEESVIYFARDDGEENLGELGHRRWLLCPWMAETGFGLAQSEEGDSYALMYACDLGADPEWSEICWPAPGVFPVELMHSHLAWSIVLNEEVYDLEASRFDVTLSEPNLGLSFGFDCGTGAGDGDAALNREAYGAGPCLIFRPDFRRVRFGDYLQNQRWHVRVEGLKRWDGGDAVLEYDVEMASLYTQDVIGVELSAHEGEMKAGETLALTAAVIPEYADDLDVAWRCSDETLATVAEGVVTALRPGTVTITAESANGREDSCKISIK